MGAIRLEIPSDRYAVDLAETLALGVARLHQMPDSHIDDFGLAVRESVINAIVHGNQDVSTRRVSVEFVLATPDVERRLVTTVCDEGYGFDWEDVPDPLAPENLLKPTGRGLLFIRAFTDDLSVRRVPAGGTVVRFTNRLNPPRQPSAEQG